MDLLTVSEGRKVGEMLHTNLSLGQLIWIQFRMTTSWWGSLTLNWTECAQAVLSVYLVNSKCCLFWQWYFYRTFSQASKVSVQLVCHVFFFFSLSHVPHKSSSLTWITGWKMCLLWCRDDAQPKLITLSRMNTHAQWQNTLTWPFQTAPATSFSAL